MKKLIIPLLLLSVGCNGQTGDSTTAWRVDALPVGHASGTIKDIKWFTSHPVTYVSCRHFQGFGSSIEEDLYITIDTAGGYMRLSIEGDTTNAPLSKSYANWSMSNTWDKEPFKRDTVANGNEEWETTYDPKIHEPFRSPMYVVVYENWHIKYVMKLEAGHGSKYWLFYKVKY